MGVRLKRRSSWEEIKGHMFRETGAGGLLCFACWFMERSKLVQTQFQMRKTNPTTTHRRHFLISTFLSLATIRLLLNVVIKTDSTSLEWGDNHAGQFGDSSVLIRRRLLFSTMVDYSGCNPCCL